MMYVSHTIVSLIGFGLEKIPIHIVCGTSIEHNSRVIGSYLPAYLDLATHLKEGFA